jgi:hypothetical protein
LWLRDGRRVIFRGKKGVFLLDTKTRTVKPLVSVGGYSSGRSLGLTADGRTISYTETATEGDIWLMRLDAGEGSAKR